MNHNLLDTIRVVAICTVASAFLYLSQDTNLPDAAFGPLLTGSAVLLYLVAFNHITRRLLFPSIDLRAFFTEARNGNIAAAIVAAAVLWVFVSLVQVGAALISR